MLVVGLLAGCANRAASVTPAPAVNSAAEPPSAAPVDWGDYALALYRVVEGDAIRGGRLADAWPLLERTLAQLAERGPQSTPDLYATPESRTAWYINAHNLLMLAEMAALSRGAGGGWPPGPARRWRIDGQAESVYSMQTRAVRSAAADWRVAMALFSGRRVGPPLWHRPVLADMLDVQLDEITRAALASPRVVRIDHGLYKQLLLWEGLFNRRAALVADYERRLGTSGASILNVLLEWATPFQRGTLNSAVGYEVVPMPDDARIPLAGK